MIIRVSCTVALCLWLPLIAKFHLIVQIIIKTMISALSSFCRSVHAQNSIYIMIETFRPAACTEVSWCDVTRLRPKRQWDPKSTNDSFSFRNKPRNSWKLHCQTFYVDGDVMPIARENNLSSSQKQARRGRENAIVKVKVGVHGGFSLMLTSRRRQLKTRRDLSWVSFP